MKLICTRAILTRTLVAFLFINFIACESFLEVELSKAKITGDLVFTNDITATSAVTGIYQTMLNPANFASGSPQSLMALTALSADELVNYPQSADFIPFQENEINPENSNVLRLWTSIYKTIYESNAVLEGLDNSLGTTINVRNQLKGEALFIRAFCYFNLVNLFGDAPLAMTTDYQRTAKLHRTNTTEIFAKVVEDLSQAIQLLNDTYPTSGRVRPNRFAALALLAKTYLYTSKWKNAEVTATEVISNSTYSLELDLNRVFLANSKEAIWQLMPVIVGYNTNEARFFAITGDKPLNHILSEHMVDAFETGDKRLQNWIVSKDFGTEVFHSPSKYKAGTFGQPLTEYSIVYRLAELYLIRAEARAQLNDLHGAINDVDAIRQRAGLPLIKDSNPNIDKQSLLAIIDHERRVELFTEWGNRWFDLKRTGQTEQVLAPIKAQWSFGDELYPIPAIELRKNPFLGTQNPGY